MSETRSTSNYTLVDKDGLWFAIVKGGASGYTFEPGSASALPGQLILVIKGDSAAGAVTVGSWTLTAQYDFVWVYSDGSAWRRVGKTEAATSTYSDLVQTMIVEDQKTSGTAGGTFTSGAWQTRTLNTEVLNGISGASLASNQITLPAGTYDVRFVAPAAGVSLHKAKICDITHSTDLIIGSSEDIYNTASVTKSTGFGRFVLSGETVIELQHYCSATGSTQGFGQACGFSVVEVYAHVEIQKIA